MLQLFMDFSISRERSFQYMYELFKLTYLPTLYCDVSKDLNVASGGTWHITQSHAIARARTHTHTERERERERMRMRMSQHN
jgi:hypothetical protein